MINDTSVKTYQYSGMLASICEDFIAERRAVGNQYNTEAKLLSRFSHFTLRFNISPNILTKECYSCVDCKKKH